MNLKVFLGGRVAIESERGVIEEDRFPGRQGRLLFAYLVAEQGRPVPRDELADALWGEAPPASANKALAVLASKLRGLLADGGIDGGKALTSAFGSYRLILPDGAWVDIVAAADALRDAEAALATDDFDQAKKLGLEAASLARASFLPGEEGAWVDGKRRELTDIHRRALGCLAEASLRSGDEAEAATWAEETIALDPYRETGYRQLMAAHAAAGNRAEALLVYERCRQLLATELGAYPSPETESIYRELLEAPTPGATAAAPETAPVAIAEREPPRAESPPPAAVPRSLWRRRKVVIGALAGVAAAVVIPLFALGGGSNVALGDSNGVGVLDGGSGKVKDGVELRAPPTAIAAGLDYVWTASANPDAVYAIDPETNTEHDKIEVDSAPGGIAVGGRYVWVTNSLTGTVSQIDPESLSVLRRIHVGNGPTGVAARGGYVWVANTLDHTVSKIRASTGMWLKDYPAGTDPGAVAVGEGAVWVASKSDNTVVKLSPRNGQLLKTIHVGEGPAALATGLDSIWVANSVDGTVTQIDPKLGSGVHTEKVGANLSGIAIVGDEVWTTNERAGTVSRITPGPRWQLRTVSVGGRLSGLATRSGRGYVALRPAGMTHRGGTLTVALDSLEPLETLDLAVGSLPIVMWRFTPLTNDGLLAYRSVGGQAGSEVVPDLARSMQVSQDGKTYTFQLRPNIRYSNGRPVQASDFRYSIERAFKVRRRTDPRTDYLGAADVFSGIRGANGCNRRRCNLADGIVADDIERTIAFHLLAPDPYFRYKLASTFADPVPARTPLREATHRPLPSTGPYRIANVTRNSVRLERNPYFREWSATIRPDGLPNEIVLKSVPTKKGIALVEQGKADLTSNFPLEPFSVAPTFRPQLKPHPLAVTVYLVLDPSRPPFNDLRARRALNYALDRNKVAQLATKGSRPTCQVLPPNFPGYRAHCPYTLPNADGAWTAPDPTRAAQLVAASRTKGSSVTLWVDRDFVVNPRVGQYLKRLLKSLGYRPRLRESFPGTPRTYFVALENGVMTRQRGPRIAFAAWQPDYPSASSVIQELFACASKFNYSRLCDPMLERTISRAVQLEQTDRVSANDLWAKVDREITDRALWVPLFNGYQADLVSKRVGNYEYNPLYGALLSQMWVR